MILIFNHRVHFGGIFHSLRSIARAWRIQRLYEYRPLGTVSFHEQNDALADT